jgi:hypothetical protein
VQATVDKPWHTFSFFLRLLMRHDTLAANRDGVDNLPESISLEAIAGIEEYRLCPKPMEPFMKLVILNGSVISQAQVGIASW